MMVKLTERQIKILSEYNDEQLLNYLEEGRRRLREDKVVLNSMELLDNMEVVEKELERRRSQADWMSSAASL